MIRSTLSRWVASSASSSRPPPATRLDAALGQTRRHRRLGGDLGQRGVRVRRRGGAAQDDRVAGLQAQRGGVDRDVRAGLVDDGDDAERHAHLAHVQAVRQAPAVDHLADGVRQRGDLAHGVRDRGDARRRQGAGGRAARRRCRPRGRAACRARWPRGSPARDRPSASAIASQGGVLDGRVDLRERSRGALGGAADVRDRLEVRLWPSLKGRALSRARGSRGGPPPRWHGAGPRAPPRTSGR